MKARNKHPNDKFLHLIAIILRYSRIIETHDFQDFIEFAGYGPTQKEEVYGLMYSFGMMKKIY